MVVSRVRQNSPTLTWSGGLFDVGTPDHNRKFREGDHALIIDRRGRRYLHRLHTSGAFHSHIGNFSHDDLIGQEEGTWITTPQGHTLLAVRPTMADFTLENA